MTITEAEGFADLGMWREAWEALEDLPAELRGEPPALRVRLRWWESSSNRPSRAY